jgi:antirestriction protein ArdC
VGAAFLCAEAGVEPATLENSAAYVAAWIRVLKGDSRVVVHAAAAAQNAADWILRKTGA